MPSQGRHTRRRSKAALRQRAAQERSVLALQPRPPQVACELFRAGGAETRDIRAAQVARQGHSVTAGPALAGRDPNPGRIRGLTLRKGGRYAALETNRTPAKPRGLLRVPTRP